MDAIISDIHGNLEALIAVQNRIEQLGCDRVICLGDVVCFGPDSIECIRRSSSFDLVVAGRFDLLTLEFDSAKRNTSQNHMIDALRASIYSLPDAVYLFQILRGYKETVYENDLCYAHGTPEDVDQYIFPESIYDEAKLNRIGNTFKSYCFVGSTHLAGIFEQDANLTWSFEEPEWGKKYFWKPNQKIIVNVGSVGQPRDDDVRACFVTKDTQYFQFHRVKYDAEVTIAKILANPDIDDIHGARLREGK